MQVINNTTKIKCDIICGTGKQCNNFAMGKDNETHVCGLHVPIPGEELTDSSIICQHGAGSRDPCKFKARVLYNGKQLCCVHAKSELLKHLPITKKGPIIGRSRIISQPTVPIPNTQILSDEEMAHRLQEEFDRDQLIQPEESALGSRLEQNEFDLRTQRIKITNVNTNCAVCQESFTSGQDARMLPCCHIFHLDCIDQWLLQNPSCPNCRESI